VHRKKALSYIEDAFVSEPNTLLFYAGSALASESNNELVVKLLLRIDYFSILFGMSMVIGKKIVIVCEDSYLLGYLSSLVQIAVGRPKNVVIICLVTKTYVVGCSQATLFNSVNSVKGILFNIGFLVHDYTQYFKNKTEFKKLVGGLREISGPLISTILIDDSKLTNIGKIEDNFTEFVNSLGKTNGSNNSKK